MTVRGRRNSAAAAEVIDQARVSAFRLKRHHLAGPPCSDPVSVCGDVCGLQAQVMSAAETALWARTAELKQKDLHAALWEARTLVKSSFMRQTLHVVPARDFFLYIAALRQSRIQALRHLMWKYGGIGERETDDLNGLIVRALRQGPMTRGELTEHLSVRVGKKMKKYMDLVWSVQIFRPALVEGLICYGPVGNGTNSFVLVDQWLSRRESIPEGEAKKALLRRYLRSYAPATTQLLSTIFQTPLRSLLDCNRKSGYMNVCPREVDYEGGCFIL